MSESLERRVKSRHNAYPSTPEEITARLSELHVLALPLQEKYKTEYLPRSDESLRYWTFFEASNFQTLPFGGGLADQPVWLMLDFSAFSELTHYFELAEERRELERRLAKSYER